MTTREPLTYRPAETIRQIMDRLTNEPRHPDELAHELTHDGLTKSTNTADKILDELTAFGAIRRTHGRLTPTNLGRTWILFGTTTLVSTIGQDTDDDGNLEPAHWIRPAHLSDEEETR